MIGTVACDVSLRYHVNQEVCYFQSLWMQNADVLEWLSENSTR